MRVKSGKTWWAQFKLVPMRRLTNSNWEWVNLIYVMLVHVQTLSQGWESPFTSTSPGAVISLPSIPNWAIFSPLTPHPPLPLDRKPLLILSPDLLALPHDQAYHSVTPCYLLQFPHMFPSTSKQLYTPFPVYFHDASSKPLNAVGGGRRLFMFNSCTALES